MPPLPKNIIKIRTVATRKQLMEILNRIMGKYPGAKELPPEAFEEVSGAFTGLEPPGENIMRTGLLRNLTQKFRNVSRFPIEEARQKFYDNPQMWEPVSPMQGLSSVVKRGPLGGPFDVGYGVNFYRSQDVSVVPPAIKEAAARITNIVGTEEAPAVLRQGIALWKKMQGMPLIGDIWEHLMKTGKPTTNNPQVWFLESYARSKKYPEFSTYFSREKSVIDVLEGSTTPKAVSTSDFLDKLLVQPTRKGKGGK